MGDGSILFVEDDLAVAAALFATLSRGAGVIHARSAVEGRRVLSDPFTWRAFVFDADLADGDGLDVLALARAQWADVPALILTAADDGEVTNRAFDLSASCLRKPVQPQRLERFLHSTPRRQGASSPIELTVERWARQYRLTAAERDVLARTVRGESRTAIAISRDVGRETLKKQVASLLLKTAEDSLLEAAAHLLREATEI